MKCWDSVGAILIGVRPACEARPAGGVVAALAVLQDVVIHRDAHVIHLPGGHAGDILLLNEMIDPLFAVIALGLPAAQVHAPADTN